MRTGKDLAGAGWDDELIGQDRVKSRESFAIFQRCGTPESSGTVNWRFCGSVEVYATNEGPT